jgi:ubiquinone/menaquinone biosynthesis C-methylase UbiE
MKDTYRLYTDLAWLWPLWGEAATEYANYCQYVTGLIRRYTERQTITLLDIGCGGGKNVFNLKQEFNVTAVDLSPTMLEQAKVLNPECTFVQGDLRTCSLGSSFDAVLMDDAISHMSCRADFAAAFRTAYAHLKPGGVLVATPDVTTETFRQNLTTTSHVKREGLDVVFIENVYDADPTDEQYETTIVYLIRDHGCLRIETDHWTMGVFSLDTWRHVLRQTGFTVHEGLYTLEDNEYTVFACIKDGGMEKSG